MSTSVSTRETKKLATECMSSIVRPSSRLRSSPRMNASADFSYISTAKRRVTLMLMPS